MNPSEVNARVLEEARAAYTLREEDKAERVARAMRSVRMPLQVLLQEGYTPLSLAPYSVDERTWAIDTVHALAKAATFTDEVLAVAFDKMA